MSGDLRQTYIAVNPTVAFQVETSTPTPNFNPAMAYLTRLKRRGQDSNDPSKAVANEAEEIIGAPLRAATPQ